MDGQLRGSICCRFGKEDLLLSKYDVTTDKYPVLKLFNIEVEVPTQEEREQLIRGYEEAQRLNEIELLESRLKELKAA